MAGGGGKEGGAGAATVDVDGVFEGC